MCTVTNVYAYMVTCHDKYEHANKKIHSDVGCDVGCDVSVDVNVNTTVLVSLSHYIHAED